MNSLRPLIVIAVCIGMYYFYISPTLGEVRALSLKKSEFNNVLEKTKELKVKRDSLLNDYGSIPPEEIERLNKVIPETFNSVIFANDVNNLASKYSMTLKEFKTSEPKIEVRDPSSIRDNNDPYKTTIVSMRISGTYENFISFLSDVETNLRLADVTNLGIQSGFSQKDKIQAMDFSLELNTYSLR
jgi:Tfp pilus assembly protein PilO